MYDIFSLHFVLAGTPRKAANTMQFLEGKVNSIPEFIPMHLRRTPNPSPFASSLLGAQLPYNALYGGEPLSVEQRALLNDESGVRVHSDVGGLGLRFVGRLRSFQRLRFYVNNAMTMTSFQYAVLPLVCSENTVYSRHPGQ